MGNYVYVYWCISSCKNSLW